MLWLRDWVFGVISPFLTQIKNRLTNIRVEDGKFFNSENVGTTLNEGIFYSKSTGGDNYGQANGNKPFVFKPNDANDRYVEINADGSAFKLLKDGIVNISLREGLSIPVGQTCSIRLVPYGVDDTNRNNYKAVFGIIPNTLEAIFNLYKIHAFRNSGGWTSVSFEWNSVFIKKDKWVSFKIEGIGNSDSGLDGDAFGLLTIQGVEANVV